MVALGCWKVSPKRRIWKGSSISRLALGSRRYSRSSYSSVSFISAKSSLEYDCFSGVSTGGSSTVAPSMADVRGGLWTGEKALAGDQTLNRVNRRSTKGLLGKEIIGNEWETIVYGQRQQELSELWLIVPSVSFSGSTHCGTVDVMNWLLLCWRVPVRQESRRSTSVLVILLIVCLAQT